MTTLATYVEMPTPRRPVDAADESLPADVTVAFGAEEAPVPGSVPLNDFLRSAGVLTYADRMVLVEQALVLLERNYVHLPLKSAMHAVNPVQRLRLLRARLRPADRRDDGARVASSTRRCRRSSTRCATCTPTTCCPRRSPARSPTCRSWWRSTTTAAATKYLVTRVVEGFRAPPFGAGVEITHWSGMPIERAVALNADRFAGSNDAARLPAAWSR